MPFKQIMSVDFSEPNNAAELVKFIGMDERLFNFGLFLSDEKSLFIKHRICHVLYRERSLDAIK